MADAIRCEYCGRLMGPGTPAFSITYGDVGVSKKSGRVVQITTHVVGPFCTECMEEEEISVMMLLSMAEDGDVGVHGVG